MRKLEEVKSTEIPENVAVKVDRRIITVIGEKGELTRNFSQAPLSIQHKGDIIEVKTSWPRKREAALVGTICSHIRNMIIGVTKGFTYKLKIAFSHFPISVKIEGRKVSISNFTGERSSRIANIVGVAQVTVNGEDIIVQGINIEDVSQTAANIEQATKIKSKDPRVFLDGIYVYEGLEGMTS